MYPSYLVVCNFNPAPWSHIQ